jgi:hypothetical protein
LESWNAYAVADGLIQEPCLLRSEMQDQVRLTEGNILTRRLEEPDYAVRFVFELADRMHRSRLPALAPLADGLIFKAITAPLVLHRLFVVLPRADSPLPPEVFTPGVFPCTPELLHLFLHYKNAFLHWALPPRLVNLGMQPPGAGRLLRDCHYYCHHRFLCVPGFADANPAPPAARLECIRHALEWAERGELPPPLPQERMQEAAGVPSFPEYYRTAYPRLRRDSQRLQESLDRLLGAPVP